MNTNLNMWAKYPHVVDVYFDFEFLDKGHNGGLHNISLGAVIAGYKYKKTFYGLYAPFFQSPEFLSLCNGEDSNSEWMLANVLRHITGTVTLGSTHRSGSISELKDLISKPDSKFALALQQTYPIKHSDDSETPGYDPDLTVVAKDAKIVSVLKEAIDACREDDRGKDNVVRLWTYYGSHDHVAMCNSFGNMMAVPDSFHQMCYDLRLLGEAFGYKHADLNPNTPHHALSDAIAQYEMTQKLRSLVLWDYGDKLGLSKINKDHFDLPKTQEKQP